MTEHKKKILWVDDDEDLLAANKNYFTQYDIICATSFNEAVKYNGNDFDLINIDGNLTKHATGDGLQVLHHFQNAGVKTPMIMITGASKQIKELLEQNPPKVMPIILKKGPFSFEEWPETFDALMK